MLFNGKYYNKPGHLGMTRAELKEALQGGGGGGSPKKMDKYEMAISNYIGDGNYELGHFVTENEIDAKIAEILGYDVWSIESTGGLFDGYTVIAQHALNNGSVDFYNTILLPVFGGQITNTVLATFWLTKTLSGEEWILNLNCLTTTIAS